MYIHVNMKSVLLCFACWEGLCIYLIVVDFVVSTENWHLHWQCCCIHAHIHVHMYMYTYVCVCVYIIHVHLFIVLVYYLLQEAVELLHLNKLVAPFKVVNFMVVTHFLVIINTNVHVQCTCTCTVYLYMYMCSVHVHVLY